ncbi:hypothetical protein [Vallicoccus soli]|uniref:hypothetical protein n=1 Tax=Vallicoccus soli TaxID=2339232 RepID=UPI0014026818|nr:hypothetical protein [Vallicoccus soli]
MPRHDAAALRSAAAPSAAALAVVAVVATVAAGAPGLVGTLAGGALVAAFFGVDHLVAARTAGLEPRLAMTMVMALYPLKLGLLALVLLGAADAPGLSAPAFAAAVVLGSLAWLAGHVRLVARRRTLVVEPDGLSWR